MSECNPRPDVDAVLANRALFCIAQGNALDLLKAMPDESVHCVMTSPPYWAMRSYLAADDPLKALELGREDSPWHYMAKMVQIFNEVRRVLRADGTLWLNMGDCFIHQSGNKGAHSHSHAKEKRVPVANYNQQPNNKKVPGLKNKDLVGMPWRVALALQASGWYLRCDNIWHKPNALPESARDRPMRSHEYVFLLSKSERYFYDRDAIREPLAAKTFTTFGSTRTSGGSDELRLVKSVNWRGTERRPALNPDGSLAGANKRSVWVIGARTLVKNHYATFPAELARICVLAGTSAWGCCSDCGAPYKRVVEHHRTLDGQPAKLPPMRTGDKARPSSAQGVGHWRTGTVTTHLGWAPSCKHLDAPVQSCIVLDPFSGAATTGVVSRRHNRRYIGLELSAAHVVDSIERIISDQPLLNRIDALEEVV